VTSGPAANDLERHDDQNPTTSSVETPKSVDACARAKKSVVGTSQS
jgi:hypothetical protein